MLSNYTQILLIRITHLPFTLGPNQILLASLIISCSIYLIQLMTRFVSL